MFEVVAGTVFGSMVLKRDGEAISVLRIEEGKEEVVSDIVRILNSGIKPVVSDAVLTRGCANCARIQEIARANGRKGGRPRITTGLAI